MPGLALYCVLGLGLSEGNLVIEASQSIPSSPQQLKVRESMKMASAQNSEIS
ncbi:MAG TPA: hypothetical protein VE223_07175 [Nitrososphaeraceae archaeon]|nr:hypothetical protein [Nitrososphaeraceae archaeon]